MSQKSKIRIEQIEDLEEYLSENLQKYSFYRTLAGAIINIILNYLLIPKYGIYGAAFATLI